MCASFDGCALPGLHSLRSSFDGCALPGLHSLRSSLLALKLCYSLFFVCRQTFGGVGAREGLRQQFAFESQTFILASLHTRLDSPLDQPDGFARFIRRDELPRVVEDLIEEIVAF